MAEQEPAADGEDQGHGGAARTSSGFNPVQMVRAAVQNSPWFAIAIAAHVVVLSIFAVWKLGHETASEDTSIIKTGIAQKKVEDEPPPEEVPDPLLDRRSIPENKEAELVPDQVAQLTPQADTPIDPNEDLTQEVGDPNSTSLTDSNPTGGTPIGVGAASGHRGTGIPSGYSSRSVGSGLRHGIDAKHPLTGTQEAVLYGLIWLARHQNNDGSWSALTYGEHCPKDKICMSDAGKGDEAYTDKVDVGLTGLALLTYLGAGLGHDSKFRIRDTYKGKMYEIGREVVLKAINWLRKHQNADGSFSEAGNYFMYNDAIAALALSEAFGMSQEKALREPAQKAIDFVCASQKPSPDGKGKWGWRYTTPTFIQEHKEEYPDEKEFRRQLSDADISVTGWCVMALKSAEASGLDVPQEAVDGALAFCKFVSNPSGLVGYLDPSAAGVDLRGAHDTEFKYFGTSMASVAMCIRVFLEHNSDDAYLKQSAEQIIKNLPDATKDKNGKSNIDYYYWYYGSLALNQLDGPDSPKRSNKFWPVWNKAMQDSILGLQNKDEKQGRAECTKGGFLTPDRWSFGVGPVYTTAINVLTLEVYYRYPNAFGAAQDKKVPKKTSAAKSDKPVEAAKPAQPGDNPPPEKK